MEKISLENMTTEEINNLSYQCEKILRDRREKEAKKLIENFHKAYDELSKNRIGIDVVDNYEGDEIEIENFDNFQFTY